MACAATSPDGGCATCCAMADGSADGAGVSDGPVNRTRLAPGPALRNTGVYPMTGPYRANCVCSCALYTTTPSGALVPLCALKTGTATSSAGRPPASISTPSTPEGHSARKAALAAIVALDCWHATVVSTFSASRIDASAAVTWGIAPCFARRGRRMDRGSARARGCRTRWCTARCRRRSARPPRAPEG